MADRRRNPDHAHLRTRREIAERVLRAFVIAGAVAGWAFVAYALRAQFTGA